MKLSEEIDEWMDEDQGECITPPLLKWMMSAEALEKQINDLEYENHDLLFQVQNLKDTLEFNGEK